METTRTILSHPKAEDYEQVFQLLSNEQSRQFLGGPVHRVDFDEKFKSILAAKKPECYWIVREKDSDVFIGFVSITQYHDQIHYEVSYELLPTFWGQGYGMEIVQEVIEYGFTVLELEELYAETQKKNQASIRLLEKVGMIPFSSVERYGETQLIYSIRKHKI